MRILHIVPTYLPAYRYGGPILSVHALNKWLVKKGMDVTVYTTNIDGPNDLAVPLNEPVLLDGVKVFYFQGFFPRKWFYSLDLHIALAKTIKNFDLVHITSVFLAASALGAYYAKKFRKPYIISPRGSLMKEPLGLKSPLKKRVYLDLIEKRNLAGAAAIHFTVEAEKSEYLTAGLTFRNSFVIPNGLDLDEAIKTVSGDYFREKFKIAADKKIVLFLSRLNWKKGLDTLVPAFKKVLTQEPKAILVLAGGDDDGYKKQIEQRVSNYRLEANVIFTGMLLDKEKVAAFEAASVFVLPSYSENFGMAVLEALSHTPVVVTEGVAISFWIRQADAGIVVHKDENELAEAILKVLKNPKAAQDYKERGRKLTEKEFSMPVIADSFINEYNKIISHETVN